MNFTTGALAPSRTTPAGADAVAIELTGTEIP